MNSPLIDGVSHRPFAYSAIIRHPPMSGQNIPPELATVRKYELSCVVILPDNTLLATWSQGSFENAPDEQVVMAIHLHRYRDASILSRRRTSFRALCITQGTHPPR